MKYIAQVDNNTYEIEIMPDGEITLNGKPVKADLTRIDSLGLFSLLMNHHSYELVLEEQTQGYRVSLGANTFNVTVVDERHLRMESSRAQVAAEGGDLPITAPIPGLVVKILVEEGQIVDADAPLVLLEAMKMENEIRAPRAGVIQNIGIEVGQSVEGNTVLMVLGAMAEDAS